LWLREELPSGGSKPASRQAEFQEPRRMARRHMVVNYEFFIFKILLI